MKNNIHTRFILTPIADILKETVTACHCVGNGIETIPLYEYVMQTTFLKMTGASEQKLKCVCWEMATYDYEYRYFRLSKPFGECSCYDEKKNIFSDMLFVIGKMDLNYNFDHLFPKKQKEEIRDRIKDEIISAVSNSSIEKWGDYSFLFYKKDPSKFTNENCFANRATDKNAKSPFVLFEKELKDYYENVVYRHRNRCAHNLKSYQNNLPTLASLINPDHDYENYFHMFSVLLLLDEIYMTLYKEYVSLLNNTVF